MSNAHASKQHGLVNRPFPKSKLRKRRNKAKSKVRKEALHKERMKKREALLKE